MLLFLILLLIGLFIVCYYIFNKELCSPSVLFVAPFILMCIIALFNQKTWSFELEINTFFVVLFENVFFCIGTLCGNRIKLTRCGKNCNISSSRIVKNWKLIVLVLFQIACYAIKIRYIMNFAISHGIANDISSCLVYYNNIQKFTTEETITFPSWISIGLDMCAVFGYLCAAMLAQQIVLKRKERKNIILILINYIIAVIGGMTSGGRGGSVQILLALLCAFIILYQRKNFWKKQVSLKYIAMIAFGLLFIIAIFMASTTWVGRTAFQNAGRYLSNYIGAQIYNLDYFLNSAFSRSEIWGQETFYPIIQKIAGWLGITQWANYHVGYENVYAAGYNTGNVYTAFYSYVKDFGVIGVVIMPFIFGLISQIVYRYARKSSTEYAINFSLVLYLIFSYIIAFSFFADKFGGMLFTFNTIKRIMLLFLIEIFLYKTDFKMSKIIIYTNKSRTVKVENHFNQK